MIRDIVMDSIRSKHLPGRHEQKTHGDRGSASKTTARVTGSIEDFISQFIPNAPNEGVGHVGFENPNLEEYITRGYLYHTTPAKNMASIQKNGLIGGRGSNYSGYVTPEVAMSTTVNEALYFAGTFAASQLNSSNKDRVVDIPVLLRAKTEKVPNPKSYKWHVNEVRTGNISPESLQFWNGKEWTNVADWKLKERTKQINFEDYEEPLRTILKQFNGEVNTLFTQLVTGDLGVDAWQGEMERLLAKYNTASYMAGAGTEQLTKEELARVLAYVKDQNDYLQNFAEVIRGDMEKWDSLPPEERAGFVPQTFRDQYGVEGAAENLYLERYRWRANMYSQSPTAQYWAGTMRDLPLPLPALPGEGSQCLTACKCQWRIDPLDEEKGDYDCYWELGKAEHCQTCIQRSRDWYPLRIRDGQLILPGEQVLNPELGAEQAEANNPRVTFGRQIKELVLKHLPGRHNQKTHGWRYTAQVSVVQRNAMVDKDKIGEIVLKHLPGRHNQKRHGWRYGVSNEEAINRATSGKIEEPSEYMRRWHRAAGRQSKQRPKPKPSEEITMENLPDALAINDPESGLRVEVSKHMGNYDNARKGWEQYGVAMYEIKNKDNVKVGEIEIAHDFTGEMELSLIVLHKDYQNSGFGSRWVEHFEDSCRKAKLDRIVLHANIDVGGYTWARLGYDFATSTILDKMKRSLSGFWRDHYNDNIPGRYITGLHHSWEIAALTGPDGYRIGKEFLLGSDWGGYKQLNGKRGEKLVGYEVGKEYYNAKKK